MANYGVKIPFTGYLYVEVEACGEEEAIQAAFELDLKASDADELEFHTKIVGGNVFYGVLNEIEVELVDTI